MAAGEAWRASQALGLLFVGQPLLVVRQAVAGEVIPGLESPVLVPAAVELGNDAATVSLEAFPRHGPLSGRRGVQPRQRPSALASMHPLESGWDASGVGIAVGTGAPSGQSSGA